MFLYASPQTQFDGFDPFCGGCQPAMGGVGGIMGFGGTVARWVYWGSYRIWSTPAPRCLLLACWPAPASRVSAGHCLIPVGTFENHHAEHPPCPPLGPLWEAGSQQRGHSSSWGLGYPHYAMCAPSNTPPPPPVHRQLEEPHLHGGIVWQNKIGTPQEGGPRGIFFVL